MENWEEATEEPELTRAGNNGLDLGHGQDDPEGWLWLYCHRDNEGMNSPLGAQSAMQ